MRFLIVALTLLSSLLAANHVEREPSSNVPVLDPMPTPDTVVYYFVVQSDKGVCNATVVSGPDKYAEQYCPCQQAGVGRDYMSPSQANCWVLYQLPGQDEEKCLDINISSTNSWDGTCECNQEFPDPWTTGFCYHHITGTISLNSCCTTAPCGTGTDPDTGNPIDLGCCATDQIEVPFDTDPDNGAVASTTVPAFPFASNNFRITMFMNCEDKEVEGHEVSYEFTCYGDSWHEYNGELAAISIHANCECDI